VASSLSAEPCVTLPVAGSSVVQLTSAVVAVTAPTCTAAMTGDAQSATASASRSTGMSCSPPSSST